MRLIGQIEIFGAVRYATVEIKEQKCKGVTYVPSLKKYKAYGYVDGKIQFYGYYENETGAGEAARLCRNLSKERKSGKVARNTDSGIGVTCVGASKMWRVQLTIGGKRVSLGRYMTFGNAVLVRDVVARRVGVRVVVGDYSMPLALVTDPVARSYVTDRILPPTADELTEYGRQVDKLNGVERAPVVAPLERATLLPPETWQVKQPSRAGRSPFDTLDDA